MNVATGLTPLSLYRMVREYERPGRSLPADAAVEVLQERGRITVGELAEQLYSAASTLTSLLDRLEREGVVRRFRTDEDRRAVWVELAS